MRGRGCSRARQRVYAISARDPREAIRQPVADQVSDPLLASPASEGATIEELFLTALTNVGYRDAIFAWPKQVVTRFDERIRLSTRQDPQWTTAFLRWLRTETPMRYPALVGAATFVSERLARGEHGTSRQVVDSLLRAPEDPGHLLAHWISGYGKQIPKPVKRGVADAVARLYDESTLRDDTAAYNLSLPPFINNELTYRGGIRTPRPLRFGDVIELVHPVARGREQGELFRHVLARRHGRMVPDQVAPQRVPPSGAGREVWDELVASMSLADLLANLRRFDAAAIPFETAMTVAARIGDPAEVRASGLLPLSFLKAHQALRTTRWFPALAKGAAHNVSTLPRIPGRTLILAEPGTAPGVVLALTLAQRCAQVDVVADKPFELAPDESPLDGLIRWQSTDLNRGRDVGKWFTGHDRVVIAGEELPDLDDLEVPPEVPVYAWQSAHHRCLWDGCNHDLKPRRLLMSGLTDDAFSVIPLAEAAREGRWPW